MHSVNYDELAAASSQGHSKYSKDIAPRASPKKLTLVSAALVVDIVIPGSDRKGHFPPFVFAAPN